MGHLIFMTICLALGVFVMNLTGEKRQTYQISETSNLYNREWDKKFYIIFLFLWLVFSSYWIYDSIFYALENTFDHSINKSDPSSRRLGESIMMLFLPGLLFAAQILYLGMIILGSIVFTFILIFLFPEHRYSKFFRAAHYAHLTMLLLYILFMIIPPLI